MKKVVVIGATGFVGAQVVKELVNRGYEVEAIARDASQVLQHDKVTAKSVDVNDIDNLVKALQGNDAVINTFNGGWTNPNLYNDFLQGSLNIEKAVEKSGIKRFITVGGAGSLYIGEVQLVDGPDFPSEIKPGATAARDYLNIIKENKVLDWTFFSPAIEMHQGTAGIRVGKYRTGLENPVFDEKGRSVLSVEDVAVVLADELEQNNHIRERFTAAY
ncbi:NAD-dependent epimerase/dehydratase family protein [Chryseobacterium nematophagum]|uniref:NAD-dependent epimerase/dehydratase family protein n=1 Tax=Chryseobacterium nematophagum TaxID=2305228 RepID=A0A3M7LAI4_9FLAO|nr:NAD(P)H-binding protein [Chryseobacterium nematophagum]RMZ59044.1 NAD-dependent epimerase/dehydratase family protein [Chryseobacterium nematophagum]